MKKRFLKSFIAVLLVAAAALGSVITASAEYVPYESYTYWEGVSGDSRKAVINRPMYNVYKSVDAGEIGAEPFDLLVDVCTDGDGFVYLLDKKSRITVLDRDYKLVKEINSVTGQNEYTFEDAGGIYVHSDRTIYICDKENNRVLHCDNNGAFIDEFLLPDSPLIPSDFEYKPVRAVADTKGYLYVLSEGSYYGALLYAPDKSFVGFYGANTVTNNILGAVKSLFNRMFPNNAKAAKRAKVLPYSFSDIVIDSQDFIYTATDSSTKGQIKKLSPGAGNNILNSGDVNFTDDSVNRTYNIEKALEQRITGLAVSGDGFIYCLDATYGRVFVYDSKCRMLTAFGGGMGQGNQKGVFTNATAIAVNGSDVLVTDNANNTLTVFRRNEYGERVMQLTELTNSGCYAETRDGWEAVLQQDKNLQIAYTGLARVYLADGEYKKAMDISLEGYDRETYALAYKYYRSEYLSAHFSLIFGIVIIVLALLIALFIILKKKQITLIKNRELKLMFKALIHPGLTFEEIKDKKRGSVKLSVIVLVLFYVTAVLQTLWGGFFFTEYDPAGFNSLWVLVQTVGLIALWIAANWMICTLLGGKGKIREIIIVTCYSLLPIIIERIIWIVFSNILLPAESGFLGILTTVAVLWSFLLLIIGMMRIHEFTAGRFVLTSLLTVLAMAGIALLIILVMILVQQFGGFIATVITEIFM